MKRKRELKSSRYMPVNIDRHTWFYEMPSHLMLVHEIYLDGRYIRTDQIKIYWRKIKTKLPKGRSQ